MTICIPFFLSRGKPKCIFQAFLGSCKTPKDSQLLTAYNGSNNGLCFTLRSDHLRRLSRGLPASASWMPRGNYEASSGMACRYGSRVRETRSIAVTRTTDPNRGKSLNSRRMFDKLRTEECGRGIVQEINEILRSAISLILRLFITIRILVTVHSSYILKNNLRTDGIY